MPDSTTQIAKMMQGAPQPASLKPPSAPTPDNLLSQVLSANKGFSTAFPPGSVAAELASPNRVLQANKYEPGSSLEFWPPNEEGEKSFPRPSGYPGKSVLEIFSPELKKNPEDLQKAIYGDLLHGMDKDPYYNLLRSMFIQSYPPEIEKFNKTLLQRGWNQKSIDDAYIRGRLAENQGDEWKDPSRYSPKQVEILDKMKKYISTGKAAQ